MRSTAVAVFIAVATALACSHAGPAPRGTPPAGNPPGYRVHVLSGDSLTAKIATVNGVAMDTSTVESIDASVRAMLDSGPQAPRTVEEVSGRPPDVAVDFTAAATRVPAVFHGANIQWRSKFFLSNPRWRALVGHMKLGILRFPGGQERVRYDRRLPSGTPESDTLAVTATQPYEFRITGEDVAAFIRLCRELGAEAEPQVNLTVDDPAMWRDLVDQIVNELGYDLKYVSVGNEPDVRSFNGNWPYLGASSGVNSATGRAIALDTYRRRYLAYHAAISALKPGLTYVYGEIGMWEPSQLGKNLDRLLRGLGENRPGALGVHWYLLGSWGQSRDYPDYPAIGNLVAQGAGVRTIAFLEDIAEMLRAGATAHGHEGAKLFVGEFGPSWSATPNDAELSNRLAAAIFGAEALERGKLAGFESMQWFGISDPDSFHPWVPSLIEVADADGRPTPRPQWFVYFLSRYLYGDELVRVRGGLHEEWSIHAAKDAARSYLMLVNRSGTKRFEKVAQVTTPSGPRQLRLTLHPRSVTIVSF